MKLCVKDIRELGKKYEAFQTVADSLRNEPDEKELKSGDVMVCPECVAGRMYSKEFVREAIRKSGNARTDDEIEKAVSDIDLSSVIFTQEIENEILHNTENACSEILKQPVKGEKSMHYYELSMWCSESQYFKSRSANPDFNKVVDWFMNDADDPYDEEDFKDLEELTPEEMYDFLECDAEDELREAEEHGIWTDAIVELSREEAE